MSQKFATVDDAITYFTGFAARITALEAEKNQLLQRYKQETKDFFGCADGEPMNIVQLAMLIQRVSMPKASPAPAPDVTPLKPARKK